MHLHSYALLCLSGAEVGPVHGVGGLEFLQQLAVWDLVECFGEIYVGLEFLQQLAVWDLFECLGEIKLDNVHGIPTFLLVCKGLQELQQVVGAGLPTHEAMLAVLDEGIAVQIVHKHVHRML